MADIADRAQEFIDNRIDGLVAIARENRPKFDWLGSCFCGEVEWEGDAGPHFCGVFCRDLFEKEERQRRIRGRPVEED